VIKVTENKQQKRNVKFEIENGTEFYADEVGVIHNPLKVIFDFRSITPRVDVRNQEYQPLVVKHHVIMMDPFTAKNFLDVLQQNLKNYEQNFGKIKKPAALKKMENKNITVASEKEHAPSYFG
jgi:hypothetical protein